MTQQGLEAFYNAVETVKVWNRLSELDKVQVAMALRDRFQANNPELSKALMDVAKALILKEREG